MASATDKEAGEAWAAATGPVRVLYDSLGDYQCLARRYRMLPEWKASGSAGGRQGGERLPAIGGALQRLSPPNRAHARPKGRLPCTHSNPFFLLSFFYRTPCPGPRTRGWCRFETPTASSSSSPPARAWTCEQRLPRRPQGTNYGSIDEHRCWIRLDEYRFFNFHFLHGVTLLSCP